MPFGLLGSTDMAVSVSTLQDLQSFEGGRT
jgi:hypothetical protein